MSTADTEQDADRNAGPEAEAANAGDERDDRSSSLSEPEDEPDDDMLQNGIRQDMQAAEEFAARQSLEVDSEAETERLDQTPQRLRRHADGLGKTPSKLSQAATADDDLSDPPSPLPAGPGGASSTSTVATNGKKRKRSDTGDSSLTSAGSAFDESPRKRSHDSVEDENADGDPSEAAEIATMDLAADEELDTPAVPAKAGRGRKGKVKGKLRKEAVKEAEPDSIDENIQADDDQSEESTGKNAEELQHKHEASTLFEDLAKQFTAFREKLFSERLAALTAELDMLNQPNCKHPEFLRQIACVDARYTKQVAEVQAFYRYKVQTLRRSTLAERGQLHGQYFQYTRELRENVLSKLGDDWYNIQKERRQSNQANDDAYIAKFATKKSVQIRQQAKYNQEVSILSGVAKYVGFPAAPEITGTPVELADDDLKAMKINKRAQQPVTHSHVPFLSFGNSKMAQASNQIEQHERLAHEQFIEQNAWARPQGPIHSHGTPNLTHTPDWAEPVTHNSTKHLMRNISGNMHHSTSPYTTPTTQRRALAEQSSAGTVAANSDPAADLPSNTQAAVMTTTEQPQGLDATGNTSPLAVSKSRQTSHPNGAAEAPGFRNVSGASTIDAPPDAASEKEHVLSASQPSTSLSGVIMDATAPQSIFETSQLPRHGLAGAGAEQKSPLASDSYAHPGFRPRDGAFGTPTPFGPSTSTTAATTTASTANGS